MRVIMGKDVPAVDKSRNLHIWDALIRKIWPAMRAVVFMAVPIRKKSLSDAGMDVPVVRVRTGWADWGLIFWRRERR